MLTGINRNEVVDYVSKLDKDSANPTKFGLGVMSGECRFTIVSAIREDDPKTMYGVVKQGIRYIKNINLNGKAQDIDTVTDEVLDSIPTVVITELFNKIFEMNFLGEQEIKN